MVLVGVSACTPLDRGARADATASVKPHASQVQAPQRPSGHVITTMQARDHEVTIYATAGGTRFTVAASGGVVLAERLTDAEFRDSFPGLHERYESAFAADGTQLDARLDRDVLDSSAPASLR